MPAKKFTTADIKRTLDYVCNTYALTPQYTMSTSGEFFVKTLVGDKAMYLLKIRKVRSPRYKQRFLSEISINNSVKNLNLKKLVSPRFIASDTDREPEYLLYQFIEGTPLNTYYFYIGARQAENLLTSDFLHTLSELQNKLTTAKNISRLPANGFKKNFELYKKYEKSISPYIGRTDARKVHAVLQNHRHYFDQQLVVSHGDINPKNLIMVDGKAALIDWSDVQLNNPLFDYCSLYLYAWNSQRIMDSIKRYILHTYDYLDNADRLYLLNRVILTPQIIKITEDSIAGIREDRRKRIILAKTEKELIQKARLAIRIHIEAFRRIVRHLELWQRPDPTVRAIDKFLNVTQVNNFFAQEHRQLSLPSGWDRVRILNLRLAVRQYDQKMISQYELIKKNKKSVFIMGKIRMERGDDLAQQSYQVLKTIRQNSRGPTFVSRPLGYYKKYRLFIYEKVIGDSLAHRLEQHNINITHTLPRFIKQAGEILHALHRIPTDKFASVKLTNNYGTTEQLRWLNYYVKNIPALKNKRNLKTFYELKVLHNKIKKLALQKTLIHGDFQLQNLIIKNDRSRITLIDFDNTEINDPLIDVGNFLYQMKYKNILGPRTTKKLRKIFFDNYKKDSKLMNTLVADRRLNFYIIMAVVKNINFNCLNGDIALASYDMKIISYLLKHLEDKPLANLSNCQKL